MFSPSPTSSVNSSSNSFTASKNGPQKKEYLKYHKNISFSYAEDSTSFQHGQLGDNDTFLVGTLHLNYQKKCQVKSVYLHLKGVEKTMWHKSQARAKYVFSGENALVNQSNKIWEAYDDAEEISTLDIPFKVQLPYNLPDTITTEIGIVQYILRATINTKSIIGSGQQMAKLECPLRRTLVLDNNITPPYKLCGETPSGIDYTFILPPNKSFNLGTYVSIPMKLRFLQANIGIDKLEVNLKTSMDFQSTTQGESKHVDKQIMSILIPRSELLFVQPSTSNNHGECTHTINLFISKNVQPTYQGRFISIAHSLSIKFCLWGFETDFKVEESVRIAQIVERQLFDVPASPLTPQITPPMATLAISPQLQQLPPVPVQPSLQNSYLPNSSLTENNVSNQYFYNSPRQILYGHQSFDNVNSYIPPQLSSDPSRNFYDKAYDGYSAPQQPLNYNFPQSISTQYINGLIRSENSSSSRTSTPSIVEDSKTSTKSSPSIEMITTHLSPPPYRQPVMRQISEVADHRKNVEHSNK